MDVDKALRALADGTRRQILVLVWRNERTAGEIASAFAMTRPGVSQHLTVLRESELVLVRSAGVRRYYRANRTAVAQLRAELGAFWDDRLVRLRNAAEAAERKGRRQ
jgi:DNA-binding transcriptional ArsR family regulator